MFTKKEILYDEKKQLKLDLYQPEKFSQGIIDLHGGGWFRGSKEKEAGIAEKLAALGFLVVVPEYRLAPQHIFPAALEDVLAVFQWTLANFELKQENIAAFGSSAGGNLAIELALQKGIPAVSWSGIIDLADWVAKHPEVVASMN